MTSLWGVVGSEIWWWRLPAVGFLTDWRDIPPDQRIFMIFIISNILRSVKNRFIIAGKGPYFQVSQHYSQLQLNLKPNKSQSQTKQNSNISLCRLKNHIWHSWMVMLSCFRTQTILLVLPQSWWISFFCLIFHLYKINYISFAKYLHQYSLQKRVKNPTDLSWNPVFLVLIPLEVGLNIWIPKALIPLHNVSVVK